MRSGEQGADVVGVDGGAERVAVVQHAGELPGLPGFQRHDLVLDGVPGHETVDRDVPGLPDAVGPVDGLRLGRGVPPGIEQEADWLDTRVRWPPPVTSASWPSSASILADAGPVSPAAGAQMMLDGAEWRVEDCSARSPASQVQPSSRFLMRLPIRTGARQARDAV